VGWTTLELGFEYQQQQQKPVSFLLFPDWLQGAPSLLANEYNEALSLDVKLMNDLTLAGPCIIIQFK